MEHSPNVYIFRRHTIYAGTTAVFFISVATQTDSLIISAIYP